MPTPIQLSFPCSICGYVIRGEYEEEDFEYPVFCPKCGRQNQLPSRTTTAEAPLLESVPPVLPKSAASPNVPEITVPKSSPAVAVVSSTTAVVKAVDAVKANVESSLSPASVSVPQDVSPVQHPMPPRVPLVPPPPQRPSRIAWRFRPEPGRDPSVALRNCAAVDDQGRVIAALGKHLFALVPLSSGCEVAWKFSAADLIPGSPVIGEDGVVFAHSSDGLLHALDRSGLPIRVPTKIGPALGWATPLIDGANCVWTSAATGGVTRVDSSGQTTPRPFLRSPSRFDCTGVLHQDVLYIGSEDQFLHAIDLHGDRGRELWSQRDKVGLTGWYINSAMALADGPHVIAVSCDDCLYAFGLEGTVAWSVSLNGRAFGSPVIAPDGTIIVGLSTRSGDTDDLSGRLVGIQSKTGHLAWSVEFDAPLESTPVVGDSGEVYVGDNSGKIHAVSLQGHRIWSESVDAAVRSAGTILPTGQVLFGLDDGSLVAVRCDSRQLGAGWPKLLGTAANRCPLT